MATMFWDTMMCSLVGNAHISEDPSAFMYKLQASGSRSHNL